MTIRPSQPGDARRLRNLAQLDSAQPLYGEALMAEVGGEPLAAVEVRTGRAIADPFAPTRALVDLLRLRAAQLR
jgi:hypothetical protein